MGFPSARFLSRPIAGAAVDTIGVLGAIPVTMQDALAIRVRNTVTGQIINVLARVLSPDGSIETVSARLTPINDSTLVTSTIQLVAGWLVSVHLDAEGVTPRGRTYITVGIQFGTLFSFPSHIATLIAAYLTGNTPLGWPPGLLESSRSGRGWTRRVTVASPALGANFTQTVTANRIWRIVSVKLTLVTGATVATRLMRLRFILDAGDILRLPGFTTQIASLTYVYSFFHGAAGFSLADPTGGEYRLQPMPLIELAGGEEIASLIGNIQGDDQLSDIQLYVDELLEDESA